VDATWPLSSRWTVRGGVRRDLNHFAVTDHLLADGDASGARTLSATSGNAGLALQISARASVWTNISTVFQTPTTTELANRPDGGGGFNPDLDPERSVTAEVGMRAHNAKLSVELAVYHTSTDDAIVPYSDVGGRSYFRNAGSTRTQGAEVGARFAAGPHVALLGSWTLTDAIFSDYGVVNGITIDTLTGRTLAGVPRQVAHVGIQGRAGAHLTFDIDQGWSSSLYADDDNTIRVDGWGAGVTGVRAGWSTTAGRWAMRPYVAALNLFDRRYVGSVTIDGAAGRVFEPAPRRTIYVGVSLVAH
jgi:iron complex outermembrane receptor protein